jgi:hypothetical protein
MEDDNYEAKNPLISLLGKLLPRSVAPADAAPHERNPLDEIDWAAPKLRGLSLAEMSARLEAGLIEREWFVTGRSLPELFSDAFAFSDPDVSLKGIEPYSRQVRRLFDQETSRCEIVSCAPVDGSDDGIRVVWRLSGGVNLGPAGLAIKPYIVHTTLMTDSGDGGLVVFQKDEFTIPGWDIVLSALLPFLRPMLAPEAPPVEVLRAEVRGQGKDNLTA